MFNNSKNQFTQSSNGKDVVQLPIEDGFISIRCLSPKKLRFEIEYSLGKGTTSNAFLFSKNNGSHIISPAVLVNPPGANFQEVFLPTLKTLINKTKELHIIIGHVNPNRISLLRALATEFKNIKIICSNPGGKLLKELWYQKKPSKEKLNEEKGLIIPSLPEIRLIKQEESISIFNDYELRLIPAPTARWPGGLIALEEKTGLLMSDKLFGTHICTAEWAESNRSSTEEERRHYFDCLMTPMVSQINRIIEKIELLNITSIAPGHGPAIDTSWRSLLNDYQRWGGQQSKASIKIILLFASAYGNTASIADSLAKGISSTGVQVTSLNCEFTPANELLNEIQKADAYLIGSPTLGGHAPTPIVSALGTLLAEGDRNKPVGIFGSYGWSGEALDLLENKLRNGGFEFAFDPIKIKFSPNAEVIKTLEETGTMLGRKLIKKERQEQRRLSGGINATKSDPALLALGKVVGSLSILAAQKHEEENSISSAMVASWISQASFSPPGITIAVAKDRAVEALLHKQDLFTLNILNENNYQNSLKQFLQPFLPGEDRLSGLNLLRSPGEQPILPEAIAWIEGCVKQRMECGDHWLIYAEILHGKVLDPNGVTAVHHRHTGANY
ncbi:MULTISPECIES: diflavin flavoprotein [Prochlorococcus]|uniref:Diflavin flavoprotein n=1 Tax=Prochlorococcus marinus (strain SARG / CCMP1375 / SS120) TaxID=167539 RepID=Q7VEG9_PROMA|nr:MULTISPECIES: diflavin flavoprotein [Prochlorococcus]AAP99090.1 Diflavin flavoprotein [Prochlorococcus marinus subsp. marinus str. CCMP1375]KGG11652.1 Diflavin flavoprotein [Prochlorococcus marinus str. LG]KGG22340.1 Diflavin flavoprotein [Prochlorococcus marinus str. SS2]KGG22675.1 Diflavin flavoprotein [Prochlorococcus marinus str. SS35]KGG32903.1 Diflavin flavoprotein [Prochlorococcus marinus str. SS51]